MILDKIWREIFRPVKRWLARTFTTHADLNRLASRLDESQHGLASRLDESQHGLDVLRQGLAQTDQQAEKHNASLELLIEQVNRVESDFGTLSTAFDTYRSRLAQEIALLQTSGRFDRQALHDIAFTLFGGPEKLERTGQGAVGVVIPTCDRPEGLRRALTSIAAQSRLPDQVVVVNDGQEPIKDIVEGFSSRLKISVLHTENPHSGSSAARNLALDALDTSFVAFLDDDNLMWPRWIEQAVAFLLADPKIHIVYGAQLRDAEFSTNTKNWFLVPFDFEKLKQSNYVDLNQIMHRKSAARFDPVLRRLVDWDYVLRLIGSKPSGIIPVLAISSLYSTSGSDRITVADWPPDLGREIAEREGVADAPLPSGAHVCSCCGFIGEFVPGPGGRPNAGCPRCGSLERHRFLQLVGPLLRKIWVPETRLPERATLVEVAPSHATLAFRNLFGVSKTVDAYPEADAREVDIVASLTDLPFPLDYADVLLALHVLEHIPEDRKAMAEIARVLAPTGVAILQVPMSGRDMTDEEILDSGEERLARYGQSDHVRLYGNDFFTRLNEVGLISAAVSPRSSMLSESIRKYGLLPDEALVFAARSDTARAKACLEGFVYSLRRGVQPAGRAKAIAFDRDSYIAANPGVAAVGIDPGEHYVVCRQAEGRDPSPAALEMAIGFDRAWYLEAYPDVAASVVDAFEHYCTAGKAEGRHINEHFSFSPQQLAVLAKSYHFGARKATQATAQSNLLQSREDAESLFDSSKYWSERYRSGGNSGAGSYGRLAAFKAEIINAFVREHDIASVIEFGCGDGAQLALADYPAYLGFDVADESIDLCRSKFAQDLTKEFRNAATWDYEHADLALSLDVIFHLVEDDVFHDYMRRLFASAKRYVIVYSSNHEGEQPAAHVKHRRFTDWIGIYHFDFKLVRHIPNRWPLVDDDQSESFADFFIFEKMPRRKHDLPGCLVVSLTSYAKRFPTLELTLRRILQQSVQPDETVLWVSLEDRELLPDGVLVLQRSGLTIRTTPDIRSYKKIIPALEHYPESFVITLDDDLAYPLDTIEPLVTHYQNPNEILCRRAHRVIFDEKGNPLPYRQWRFEIAEEESGRDIFSTGCGGVLYPPHSLAPQVCDESVFMTLAPLADDVWLFWMEWLAGTKVSRVGPRYRLEPWPGCQEQGLWVTHNSIGGNDRAIAALSARYGSPFGARDARPNGSSEKPTITSTQPANLREIGV